MKRYLLTTALVGICAAGTPGDVLQEGYHVVGREVLITNLNDFPQISIVAYADGPIGDRSAYVVEQDKPLTKGYKFNFLKLFAIRKDVLAGAGGIEALDFVRIAKRFPAAIMWRPGSRSPEREIPK